MSFFRIIIFSLIFFALPSLAQSDFDAFKLRFDRRLAMCQDQQYEPVRIHPIPEDGKKQYAHCWLFSSIGRHYIGRDHPFKPETVSAHEENVYPMDYMDSKIVEILPDLAGYNEFEKVSFSKCLSSGLLDYSLENNKKWYLKPLNEFLLKGYGCCRHFSKISSRILTHLNIDHHIVCSSNHAFLQVKIDDQWYLIEPQRNDLTFYQE